MAEVIRYVDPDATGSGTGVDWANAYTSLSAWEAAEATNLVTDDDWHHVWCRSSNGTADTTGVTINGFTTDATHYVHVQAADGDQALKSGIDTDRYRLTGSINLWNSGIIDGLQLVATGFIVPVILSAFSTIASQTVRNCYIVNDQYDGIRMTGNNVNQIGYAYNNIVVSDGTGGIGIRSQNASSREGLYAYNNIVYGYTTGIHVLTDAVFTATNNAVFNSSTADLSNSGTFTGNYNASDDAIGSNSIAPLGSDWDNEFVDPANGDFTLLNTGNCYHGGATAPDADLYTTDMEGDTYYTSAYSIGVDEYAASGGIVIPTVISLIRRLIG